MEDRKNKVLGKLLAGVFLLVLIALIGLISVTFFVPESSIHSDTRELEYPSHRVWKAIYDRKYYLQSKNEIQSYIIRDSFKPRWVEKYTPSDSVENKTTSFIPFRKMTYFIINRKYQQINGFSFHLDSLSPNKTQLTCYEYSRYFNVWGAVYFQLFYPNTVLEYEFIKINNTLKYIDSVEQYPKMGI